MTPTRFFTAPSPPKKKKKITGGPEGPVKDRLLKQKRATPKQSTSGQRRRVGGVPMKRLTHVLNP